MNERRYVTVCYVIYKVKVGIHRQLYALLISSSSYIRLKGIPFSIVQQQLDMTRNEVSCVCVCMYM